MREAGKRLCLGTIRAFSAVVDIVVLTLIVLVLCFSVYVIRDSYQVYNSADASKYEMYDPKNGEETPSFSDLKALNSDVFAWIKVYGTGINYAVVQTTDNNKYVSTDIMGNYATSGSIFLDHRSDRSFNDFNSILYGHHMDKHAMFGDIGLFANFDYFNERKYGNLYFDEKDHGLEIFAIVQTDAYDKSIFRSSIEVDSDKEEYLQLLIDSATHLRNIDVSAEDNIVLLATCSDMVTNGRDLLIARITDHVYEDDFIEAPREQTKFIDRLQSGSYWLLIVVAIILVVVIILLFLLRERKKRIGKRSCE